MTNKERINAHNAELREAIGMAESLPDASGGGSCSGNHIIEVDTLPTENIDENALYKMGESYYKYGNKLKDILVVYDNTTMSLVEQYAAFGVTFELYYVKTRPTENIVISVMETDYALLACYYVEDENDILAYGDMDGTGTNGWASIITLTDAINVGAITDISQATTNDTMYALVDTGWTEYLVPNGALTITDNGTFDVTKVASVNVNTPSAAVYGIWRFDETVEKTGKYINITQYVNFTTAIEGTVYECTGMWVNASNFFDPTILQYQGDGVPSVYRGGMDTWLYDSARTVNFGAEPQFVHPDYKRWLINNATRIDGEDSIKAATELEMTAVLGIAEVGSVVKYTGTTGTYEHGALYLVEEEAAPKLSPPTISLNGSILIITDTSGKATQWNVYKDGGILMGGKAELMIDLAGRITEPGTYTITVTAFADGYEESEPSNAVEYVVEETSDIPTDLTGYTVTITAGWTATKEYGSYNLYGTYSSKISEDEDVYFTFGVGYAKSGAGYYNAVRIFNIEYQSADSINNTYSLTLNIKGGDSVKDGTLIQWFVDNNATFEKTS